VLSTTCYFRRPVSLSLPLPLPSPCLISRTVTAVPRAWLLSVFPYTLLCADAVQLAFVHDMVGRFNIVGDTNAGDSSSNSSDTNHSSTTLAVVAKSKTAPKGGTITATPRFVRFHAGYPAAHGSALQVEFAVDIHGANSKAAAASLGGTQLIMPAPGAFQQPAAAANSPESSLTAPRAHHDHDHDHDDVFVASPASDALLSALLFDHAAARHTAIVGDKGVGKSALVRHLAHLTRPLSAAAASVSAAATAAASSSNNSAHGGNSVAGGSGSAQSNSGGAGVVHVYLYKDMTVRELLQRRVTDGAGNTRWEMGPLARAALSGALVVLDGLDRLSSATVRCPSCLSTVLY
jgi:hypothetical protein